MRDPGIRGTRGYAAQDMTLVMPPGRRGRGDRMSTERRGATARTVAGAGGLPE